jgi:hypothetical protein
MFKVFSTLIIWISLFSLLILLSGDIDKELRNYLNILTVQDHSENIGIYWYIMIEVIYYYIFNFNLDFQITCIFLPILLSCCDYHDIIFKCFTVISLDIISCKN